MEKFVNIVEYEMKRNYEDSYADFGEDGTISDNEVADFLKKHLKLWDWFNPYKVVTACLWAFICLHNKLIYGSDPEEVWKERF